MGLNITQLDLVQLSYEIQRSASTIPEKGLGGFFVIYVCFFFYYPR